MEAGSEVLSEWSHVKPSEPAQNRNERQLRARGSKVVIKREKDAVQTTRVCYSSTVDGPSEH